MIRTQHYTIAIDAMSGDKGPSIVVPAALNAIEKEKNLNLILVGDESKLRQYLPSQFIKSCERLAIHHASQIVEMDDIPAYALRNKKDSSMRVAINLVKENKAQACISAGNTGALMAIAHFVLKTLTNINRPAITTVLPTNRNGKIVRLLDLGANVDSQAEHLLQFAIMGSTLSTIIDKVHQPKIALLNIGSEEIKGNSQIKAAAQLLSENSMISYAGFIEGDAIFDGEIDVVVCDGFVGNITLKVIEGTAKLLRQQLKQAFNRNLFARLIGAAASYVLNTASNSLDPAHYNGASLVGLQGIVIKSHGNANTFAFSNAINVALFEIKQNIPNKIHDHIAALLSTKMNY